MERSNNMAVRIHPTSDVAADAVIGDGTAIWLFCQVRPGAHIGKKIAIWAREFILIMMSSLAIM